MNRRRVGHRLWAGWLLVALCAPMPVSAQRVPESVLDRVQAQIRDRLQSDADLVVHERALRSPQALRSMYGARDYRPAWVGSSGPLAAGASARAALANAVAHGLIASDYRVAEIDRLLALLWFTGSPQVPWLVDLELLLTDGLALLATHLDEGRVDPVSMSPRGTADDMSAWVREGVSRALGSPRVDQVIAELAPSARQYRQLMSALQRGADLLAVGADEAGGSNGGAVCLDMGAVGSDPFAECMEAAAVCLDARTESSPPPLDPVARLRVNLERWRWIDRDRERTHVRVNIPAATVQLLEGDRPLFRVRAIVGRTDRETPELSSAIESIVLSPYWNVPRSIQTRDKLPLIKRNPSYLESSRMTLFRRVDGAVVDPEDVDWGSMTATAFARDYRLRQEPGRWNALGLIKFVFRNQHGVFLHDTDNRSLFERESRFLSSGCVRMESPFTLADYLLRDDSEWPPDRIRAVARQGVERVIHLATPIPIDIMYLTAWVDETGSLRFPPDVYGRDGPLGEALDRPLTRP